MPTPCWLKHLCSITAWVSVSFFLPFFLSLPLFLFISLFLADSLKRESHVGNPGTISLFPSFSFSSVVDCRSPGSGPLKDQHELLLYTANSPRVENALYTVSFYLNPISMHKGSLGTNWPDASADKLVQGIADKPEPESMALALFQVKFVLHDQIFGFYFVSSRFPLKNNIYLMESLYS